MKLIKKYFAALLAVCMLSLTACYSNKKDYVRMDDVSSEAAQSSQTDGNFDFTSTGIDGQKVSLKDYSSAKVIFL